MKDKYIVIDTWNGDGYSSDNGDEIEYFSSRDEAVEHAKKRRDEQLNLPYGEKYTPYEMDGYIFGWGDEEMGDYGSYQVHKINDNDYAIEILVNVNEVTILTKKEYKQKTKDLNKQIFKKMYKTMTLDNFHSSTDLEDYIFIRENKDEPFYSSIDEYDYQFRIINLNK